MSEPVPVSESETRPCVYCGRPVPQRGSAGRPFRYCRDNDGVCQRNARNSRMRERNSPGLAGQVARSWEMVERLELAAATLADALHAELSPAGVERQTATVRAEAATHVAGAHTERDEARREAEAARADVARLTDVVAAAQARDAETTVALGTARGEVEALTSTLSEVVRERDEARGAASADAARRVEAEAARDRAAVLADQQRAAADQQRAGAERAVHQRDAAFADRDAALADRDSMRATAASAAAMADEALAARDRFAAERDAVAAEAATARGDLAAAQAVRVDLDARIGAAEATAAGERDAHLRTQWERDAARAEAVKASTATEAIRAEHLAAVTELGQIRGELAAARVELDTMRRSSAQQSEQLMTMAAELGRTRGDRSPGERQGR